MAWAGLKNGALLRAATDGGFAALLTVDRGIEFQQSLRGLQLCVVTLQAPSNDINDLRPLMPRVEAALRELRPGICRTHFRLAGWSLGKAIMSRGRPSIA
jgi:hypothetical protein